MFAIHDIILVEPIKQDDNGFIVPQDKEQVVKVVSVPPYKEYEGKQNYDPRIQPGKKVLAAYVREVHLPDEKVYLVKIMDIIALA